ncbi:hypothetical protein GCM10007424_00930 [Flavobacterium suaedae]|uniref:DUF4293 family protein n=1 Tax=Flavobacterium suaedae TaxID=1767027 RepID=A0ABQ1JE23_9FLAO|nr:hypothetical protein [Flavobacterium suaedae]GGB64820.1 hypothetical protein GCM10007424_00930 [Flavobacterium suaedae]
MGKRTLRFIVFSIAAIALFFLLLKFAYKNNPGLFAINKTIGWAWTVSGFVLPVISFSFISFIIGYFLLFALKAKFNLRFFWYNLLFLLGSIALFVMISMKVFLSSMSLTYIISFVLSFITLLLMCINIGISIVNFIADKRNNKRSIQ